MYLTAASAQVSRKDKQGTKRSTRRAMDTAKAIKFSTTAALQRDLKNKKEKLR